MADQAASPKTKYIFITGGVVSSLGKGLTAGALGALLEQRGLTCRLQKFDPYLNVDPGTMSPFQHGEVYVLDDGAETDLDLGHYERFTSGTLSRNNNLTSGQIYEEIILKERRGDFLGKTVQVIPHVTDEIKKRIYGGGDDVDVLITEIGGTVGDIEGLPFLEAMRQFALEVGFENVLFIHVTLIPFLKAAGELKTKPSQQSVAKLREIGIQPHILVCRTEQPINHEIRQKLSLFCNIPVKSVIEEMDVETSIYELPIRLAQENLDDLVVDHLRLNAPDSDMTEWKSVVRRLKYPASRIDIGVVGKYIELQDAYKSVYESITHGGVANDCGVNIVRIDSEAIEEDGAAAHLKGLGGILVPGGFGDRGIEGKIAACEYARENMVPYLGLCLGMQILVIEFARAVAGYPTANSMEFAPDCEHAVINLMADQVGVTDKGATMRLGAWPCQLTPDTHSWAAYAAHYGEPEGNEFIIQERHRHRFEFNNAYREILERSGLRIGGVNPERNLVEIVEVFDHPWMVGVQFHPEFKSKPNRAHPLFAAFIAAALEQRKKGAD
ncbi:CTP synthase [Cerasicoccus arenae]|uniref:CTP synthase n=1 Tax=Cerasicoccus arenae TaxID=424488 RepID=A0A8J3GE62_9BACT|nr:CTP synthase [Cerasicoccus arenae]MBK1859182.1 CTP synthase [Cerasicoccus arenae]GHC01116.1 CTP synthase [Cerasicoccus arenae]